MTAASLFDLVDEARRVVDRIEEYASLLQDEDEAAAATACAALEALLPRQEEALAAVEAKADQWCWVIERLRVTAAARKAKADALAKLGRADAARADDLFKRLIFALNAVDPAATRWRLPNHDLDSRRTESIQLNDDLDPADLPANLQRVTIEADKTAIKDALKAGQTVAGAELITRRSWNIK